MTNESVEYRVTKTSYLGGSANLSAQKVASVVANQLLELLELGQGEVLTILMGHPVVEAQNCQKWKHPTHIK